MISPSTIEKIRSSLEMSDVVRQYLPLERKAGKNWCVCPFHADKNPSMILNDDRGTFHCFGCGEAGDIFHFVQKIDNLTFEGAVEKLAGMAHVSIERTSYGKREAVDNSLKDSLYAACEALCSEFERQLVGPLPGAKVARDYILSRHISPQNVSKMRIGWAPDDWDFVRTFLTKAGFSPQVLSQSGLFSREKGASYFVNRIVFPIFDVSGKVVAFSGRTLQKGDATKYINSSESVIFHKGKELLGFYHALPSLKTGSPLVVCEGNFDVASAQEAGFPTPVATCGTALTDDHIKMIKRYRPKAVNTMFDSDEAGIKATYKALLLFKKHGIDAGVIEISGAKDIAEVLEQRGPEAVISTMNNAVPGFEYLINQGSVKFNLRSREGKSEFSQWLFPYVALGATEMERNLMLARVAGLVNTSIEALYRDFRAHVYSQNSGYSSSVSETPADKPEDSRAPSEPVVKVLFEYDFMRTMMFRRDLFFTHPAIRKISASDLSDTRAKIMYEFLCEQKALGNTDSDTLFTYEATKKDARFGEFLQRLQGDEKIQSLRQDEVEDIIDEAVSRLIKRRLETELNRLSRALLINSNLDDNRETLELIQQKKAELTAITDSIRRRVPGQDNS